MPAQVLVAVIGVGLGLGLLVLVLTSRRTTVARSRLTVAGAVQTRSGAADETVAVAGRVLARVDPAGRLARALELAGAPVRAADLVVIAAMGMLAVGSLGALWAGPVPAVLAVLAVPLGVRMWLSVAADRRRRAFADQLDDALQLMASSLRAGHSLLRAVDAVSRDTRAPMAEEFARVVNEVRVGRDLNAALGEVAERTGSDDFRWVVQAIAVHREVGGNLAEVLDRVGETLRERAQLFRQARVLSAEGRTSGVVLLAMPFAVAALIAVAAPAYLAPLFSSVTGLLLLALALGLMLTGAVWLRSIVKVRF